jgi:glyoxylase-like metal-dependent hydrolase (beta-lactamase superfamily II)
MEEIADGIFVETGYEGVNVGAILTDEGIICIDAPSYPRAARDWITNLERLHRRHVRYLILTDNHGDRILNTRWISAPIIAHKIVADELRGYEKKYPQPLIASLEQRNPFDGRELTNSPVDQVSLSFSNELTIVIAESNVVLRHTPGPMAGTIWVYLPAEGVIFTGDSIVDGMIPPAADMYSQQWLQSLKMLSARDLSTQVIVPGRGQVGDTQAIEYVTTYIEQLLRTVENHIELGRNRTDLTQLVDEFTHDFHSEGSTEPWSRDKIQRGLERAFDEISLANQGHAVEDIESPKGRGTPRNIT